MDPSTPRLLVPIDQPGHPKAVASGLLQGFVDSIGSPLPDLARDLVHLALAVYAADLRVPRKFGDDRWSRKFDLFLPVSNEVIWKGAHREVAGALSFLTGDNWQVLFRPLGDHPSIQPKQVKVVIPPALVSLFSGGLDSFVGAIDRLAEGRTLALVGHYGSGVGHSTQTDVHGVLEDAYPGRSTRHLFYVQPPKQSDSQVEPSMRSRSILFLALGVAVSQSFGGAVPLHVAENGFISLNVPLTNARMGSLSTRTTHPHFIERFRRLLRLLNIATPIELPYRFKTKGEMLAETLDPATLAKGLSLTMSCSHPEAGRYQGNSPNLPCGHCVPCIIRRAAVSAAELPDRAHRVDIRIAPPKPETESGSDLRAFEMALRRAASETELETRLRVVQSGPLPPEDVRQYSLMFQRGLKEVEQFLTLDRTAQ